MRIWVDADACPQVIKEILYRAADRVQVLTTLVANSALRIPPSDFIRTVRVSQGSDVADHRIVQEVEPGDLVVTADIPLAAAVIARGAHALDPRGGLYSEDNVRERLAIRNLMQDLRATGTLIDGPAPFGPRERRLFADHLDHLLTRRPPA
ncbi:MAG TPA: YaiI/YqxD family protein [Candidatus Dormibacteraeota bacterium]|nr:YaiI/YqxD family protein [Candidatus Dormibacteraeota bacterium]